MTVTSVVTRALVTTARAAPLAPVAPEGPVRSLGQQLLRAGGLPPVREGLLPRGEVALAPRAPAASCDPNRVRNARLIRLSSSANSLVPAGNDTSR